MKEFMKFYEQSNINFSKNKWIHLAPSRFSYMQLSSSTYACESPNSSIYLSLLSYSVYTTYYNPVTEVVVVKLTHAKQEWKFPWKHSVETAEGQNSWKQPAKERDTLVSRVFRNSYQLVKRDNRPAGKGRKACVHSLSEWVKRKRTRWPASFGDESSEAVEAGRHII